jgi:signal transduction histidine kinase
MAGQRSHTLCKEAGTSAAGLAKGPGPQGAKGIPSPPASPDYLERCLHELVHYYRHSCAGRLVSGIVHQMNTPLQVLSFQLELLEQKNREEPDPLEGGPLAAAAKLRALHDYRRQKIRQFRLELEKLQTLTRRLILQGAHEEAQAKRPLDLNQILQEQLEIYLAQPFFKHRVKRDIRLAPGLPPIYGHYLDFSQSFRNLLDNALEAMEGAASPQLTVATALEEGCRVLLVGDSGRGIPRETLPLVFEPFFTTRRDHAGLGLFMVRRLLAPYGAAIRVESAPGATWITVSLPI